MNRLRTTLVGLVAAVALLGLGTAAFAAEDPPPSVDPALLQLCAATGVEQADSLLRQIAATKPSALDPIADIVIPPGTSSPLLVAAVQLSDVKKRLNCASTSQPTTSATPTPTAEPTTTSPAPTTTAPADEDDVFYADCDAVRAAGADPILVTEPGYRAELDPDGNGIGCESDSSEGSGVPANGQVTVVPRGGVDTGDGSTR